MANETSITDIALNSSCCDNGTIGEGIYGINKDETNTKTFNVTDMSDPMQPVRIVIATIYIAVFIFGVAGNGIILYTLMKVVKNRSVTDLYILGLAISDFLFVAMLPITATDMLMGNQWIFGGVVCKLFVSVNYLALCAGVLIVTAMSVDRFQNVVFAIKMMGVRTTKRANIIIIVVWSFSVLYMVPATITARVSEVINGSNVMACSLKYEDLSETLTAEKIATIHTVFRFFVVFLVPSIIMVFCNATIVHFLRKRREKKQKKKATTSDKDHKAQAHKREQDRITRLILIVTSVFLVCFFPNLILNTVWVLSLMTPGLINQSNSQIFLVFRWWSVCLLYINSALNPLLYAFSGSGFRQRIKEALVGKNSTRGKYPTVVIPKSPQTATTRLHTPMLPRQPITADALPSIVKANHINGEKYAVSTFVCKKEHEDNINAENHATDKNTESPEKLSLSVAAVPRFRREKTGLLSASSHIAHDARDPLLSAEVHTANDNDSGIIAAYEYEENDITK